MKPRYAISLCILALFCATPRTEASSVLKIIPPPSPITQNGIYVGPYAISVNGVATTLVCDDYASETGYNSWLANTSTLSNLSGTEFVGQTNSTQKYYAVAWLAQQMFALNPTTYGYADEIIDLHYATWAIFWGTALLSNDPDGDSTAWYNTALANNYSNGTFNLSNMVIYTPVVPGAAQEFIGETPEPASLILFGIALLAAAAVMRRHRLVIGTNHA
jgi:PEP-CTERM motif